MALFIIKYTIMGGRKWTEQEDQILIKNYSKLGATGCVNLLINRTKSSIENRAITKLNLKLEYDIRCLGSSKAKRNVNVNVDDFINISTPEVAYILGFIWADGNLYVDKKKKNHNITIKIQGKDEFDLCGIIDQTGKWNNPQ